MKSICEDKVEKSVLSGTAITPNSIDAPRYTYLTVGTVVRWQLKNNKIIGILNLNLYIMYNYIYLY